MSSRPRARQGAAPPPPAMRGPAGSETWVAGPQCLRCNYKIVPIVGDDGAVVRYLCACAALCAPPSWPN